MLPGLRFEQRSPDSIRVAFSHIPLVPDESQGPDGLKYTASGAIPACPEALVENIGMDGLSRRVVIMGIIAEIAIPLANG